MSSASCLRA
jgi:uncharacterized coiled-coil protein SlyX